MITDPAVQENRFLQIDTPFGPNKVFITEINGGDGFSKLFEYELDLLAAADKYLDPKEIIGNAVSVTILHHDGSKRHIHGFVNQFEYRGQDDHWASYGATIVPWFWFLKNRADCRIFQNKTTPDIIREVFSTLGYNDFDDSFLQSEYDEREYCVQYRETDFEFVCRLMEEEGIYYFFKHEQNKHTLVLSDTKEAYFELKDNKLAFHRDATDSTFAQLSSWRHSYEFRPGKVALTDYDFKKPSTSLMSDRTSVTGYPQMNNFEVYDYPGCYVSKNNGRRFTQIRVEELEAEHDTVHSSSNYLSIQTGGKFTVTRHRHASEENEQYVVSWVQLRATVDQYDTSQSGEDSFTNEFQCIPASVLFRPARRTPKPIVEGPQTAVIVGPAGEEIYVDEHGRVKVQFHWDRIGQNNETSSCWIRVAQSIAGNKWGFMFIPRIGQEVIIDFLEGDPDRPLIIAGVYNGQQKPHYDLPADANKMYIKSNSTKGGEGFNELMFDDTKDKERVFIHAESDFDLRVKKECRQIVLGNRHEVVGSDEGASDTGDRRQLIWKDKHANVKQNQIEHVEGNMEMTIGEGDADGGKLDVVIEKEERRKIGDGGYNLATTGSCNFDVGSSYSINIAGDYSIKNSNTRMESGMGGEIHLKSGGKVIVQATQQISLVGPGGFIDIGPAGVTIQGSMVKINSGGSAGSGGSCSPDSPSEAKIAKPTEPDVAHDSKTGFKSNQ